MVMFLLQLYGFLYLQLRELKAQLIERLHHLLRVHRSRSGYRLLLYKGLRRVDEVVAPSRVRASVVEGAHVPVPRGPQVGRLVALEANVFVVEEVSADAGLDLVFVLLLALVGAAWVYVVRILYGLLHRRFLHLDEASVVLALLHVTPIQ